MLCEHILYSLALAIFIGTISYYCFKTTLPVWIIAACAWLPDIDWILQSITAPFYRWTHFYVMHGHFHNIIFLILFAYIISYFLNKYYNINFYKSFICVSLGYIIHLSCDYFVYDSFLKLFYPLSHYTIWCHPIIEEFGSLYGIGEMPIIIWGLIFILISLTLQYLIKNNSTFHEVLGITS